jgi:hypothetical protein
MLMLGYLTFTNERNCLERGRPSETYHEMSANVSNGTRLAPGPDDLTIAGSLWLANGADALSANKKCETVFRFRDITRIESWVFSGFFQGSSTDFHIH